MENRELADDTLINSTGSVQKTGVVVARTIADGDIKVVKNAYNVRVNFPPIKQEGPGD